MHQLLCITYGEHGRVVDGEESVCRYIFASFHVEQFQVEQIELKTIFDDQFRIILKLI